MWLVIWLPRPKSWIVAYVIATLTHDPHVILDYIIWSSACQENRWLCHKIYHEVWQHLVESLQLWDSQRHNASIEWMWNFKEQYRTGFKCKDDNLRHENHQRFPKMNEPDCHGQPLPKNVMGYMSFGLTAMVSHCLKMLWDTCHLVASFTFQQSLTTFTCQLCAPIIVVALHFSYNP